MKTICVYAGSAKGKEVSYSNSAKKLGYRIVEEGYGMVYGGGSRGLMGVTADAVIEKKGKVTGDHYKTREACMLVSANYKDYPIVAFLPKEYSASDNVGECYVLGKLATTFVETKNN